MMNVIIYKDFRSNSIITDAKVHNFINNGNSFAYSFILNTLTASNHFNRAKALYVGKMYYLCTRSAAFLRRETALTAP